MQGIVLAGGEGTRLRPTTAVVNKHLLPVYDRPLIHLPIRTLVDAGVTDIVIVTGTRHVGDFEAVLDDTPVPGVKRVQVVAQPGYGGVADALRFARDAVSADRLMVLLGDNVFGQPLRETAARFLDQPDGARLLLKKTHADRLPGLGVAVMNGGKLQRIVEKPAAAAPGEPADADGDDVLTDLAVTGCYFYPADVFDQIEALEPSPRGELEITDLNNRYIHAGRCRHELMEGWWADAGTPEGLFRAASLVRATVLETD